MSIAKTILLVAAIFAVGMFLVYRVAQTEYNKCILRYPDAADCIVVNGAFGFESVPIWTPEHR